MACKIKLLKVMWKKPLA